MAALRKRAPKGAFPDHTRKYVDEVPPKRRTSRIRLAMAYEVGFSEEAREHLRALGTGERKSVLAAVRAQLLHQPTVETRNRKRMDPDKRMYVAPWELRVGRLRVYYVVEEDAARVVVLKVGLKDRDRVLIGGELFEL
jgi:mRNA-degrading endonuclease RelE of RelBE toxin-antitoxin system